MELSRLDQAIPDALSEIVNTASELDPADRYQTARELSAAIARALLDNQQLVDFVAIEDLIQDVLGQEVGRAVSSVQAQPTMVAVRPGRESSQVSSAGTSYPGRIVQYAIALISLRLDGFDDLVEVLEKRGRRLIASVRGTLDDIAYRHGSVWSWSTDTSAEAIVGLTDNPGRAPHEGRLAIDVHDFLVGLSEDLPVPLSVRGDRPWHCCRRA